MVVVVVVVAVMTNVMVMAMLILSFEGDDDEDNDNGKVKMAMRIVPTNPHDPKRPKTTDSVAQRLLYRQEKISLLGHVPGYNGGATQG
mmetsp:Transcript_15688/g.29617  ORF Transcript_15688/g.29617 Transcript_15688/m.29617 type:complete len:88 (+) Transcript_15688:2-265(+)